MYKMDIFECPHCGELVELPKEDVACGIYRHGVFKENMTQINPHESKDLCDKYSADGVIYGCGKPFQLVAGDSGYSIQACDYI